jgi:hypothetical protein
MRLFAFLSFVARACNVLSGLLVLGALFALAMHFAPVVVHTGEGEAEAFEASWVLVGVLGGTAVGLWLLARLLAFAAFSLLSEDQRDLLETYY